MNLKLTRYLLIYGLIGRMAFQNLSAQTVNDTVRYSLKQILAVAQENNRDIQLMRLDLQKAGKQIELKKVGYLP